MVCVVCSLVTEANGSVCIVCGAGWFSITPCLLGCVHEYYGMLDNDVHGCICAECHSQPPPAANDVAAIPQNIYNTRPTLTDLLHDYNFRTLNIITVVFLALDNSIEWYSNADMLLLGTTARGPWYNCCRPIAPRGYTRATNICHDLRESLHRG
jgi:hypothetical protein